LPRTAVSTFKDIVVQDGSSFAIMDSLAAEFPGRFRKVSPAAIEVHTTMSVFSDNAIRVSVAPDSQGERDFLPSAEELRDKLLLADRGYCGVEFAQQLSKAGAHYIIRFKKGINPIVTEAWIGNERRPSFSKKHFKDIVGKLTGKSADLSVTWRRKGETVAVRLLTLWNPVTKCHVLLVTDLSRKAFSAELVGTLYRLRWQVEHVFKDYKSYANLHGFCTGKAPIAEGLVWASLAAAFLKRFLTHTTQAAFAKAETSTRRAASCLVYHFPRLIQVLISGRGVLSALRELATFLNSNARRAHPRRDRKTGRLEVGLRTVHSREPQVCLAP
jgi:Transposase DDE domain